MQFVRQYELRVTAPLEEAVQCRMQFVRQYELRARQSKTSRSLQWMQFVRQYELRAVLPVEPCEQVNDAICTPVWIARNGAEQSGNRHGDAICTPVWIARYCLYARITVLRMQFVRQYELRAHRQPAPDTALEMQFVRQYELRDLRRLRMVWLRWCNLYASMNCEHQLPSKAAGRRGCNLYASMNCEHNVVQAVV